MSDEERPDEWGGGPGPAEDGEGVPGGEDPGAFDAIILSDPTDLSRPRPVRGKSRRRNQHRWMDAL